MRKPRLVNVRIVSVLALGFLLCWATSGRASTTTFDTTPFWDGAVFLYPVGNPNAATFGETFVAPSDNVLQDFSFHILGDEGVHLSMKAYVFAWSGSLFGGGGGGATGSALYASPSSILYDGDNSYHTVQVDTGGVSLTPGGQYVMLLTISNADDYAASTGCAQAGLATTWGKWEHHPGDGSGGLVYYNNGNNFAWLNTTPWDTFRDYGDVAFTAHFASQTVPEPSTLLVWSGLGAMGLMAAWRRRGRAA